MKHFVMENRMKTMRGVFYPTGHIVLMLPSKEDAIKACRAISHEGGISEDEVSFLSPEVIMSEIAQTVGSADMPLPSPGTEADTVRKMAQLAASGHWGLLVHAPKDAHGEHVMGSIRGLPVSLAQMYRTLVIEDLEVPT